VTLALVTGSLLTVANVGDSLAVLDTGCSLLPLTTSHRVQVRSVNDPKCEYPAGRNVVASFAFKEASFASKEASFASKVEAS
jgi:serine/threonine protein phosphatase PrpC